MSSDPAATAWIPLSAPHLAGNEWAYVKECLDTGWVSSAGAYVERFELGLARYLGAPHAVATVNGTAALHVALRVAGVQAGDAVLVSTLTFIAPANAVRYLGAFPVFIDADPLYWQMNPERVAWFLAEECVSKEGALRHKATGRRIAAILPVHILGHPVDLRPILDAAGQYGLPVIEDATESLGATYQGQPVGLLGDAACFSFNGNKLITTGGGGMMVTRRKDWAEKARYLTTQAKDDPVEYIHHEIGYNYRLTNVQAALGCAQLEQLGPFLAAKRAIAQRYRDAIHSWDGVSGMAQAPWAESCFWLYTVRVDEQATGVSSRALLRRLRERGIETRPLWQPVHLSKAHRGGAHSSCPEAERIYTQALSLPSSVSLSPADQTRVIECIKDGLRRH